MYKIKALLEIMRLPQWVKNVFIFLPAFFGGALLHEHVFLHSLYAFLGLSLVASSVYILNDWRDIEQDRLHPQKRIRPLAAGTLNLNEAALLGLALMLSGYLLLWFTLKNIEVLQIITVYIVLNVLYSFFLKHFAIIDVLIIALGFVIRLFIGSAVTNVELSQWIIITTFLLALFLALAKRRDDVLIFLETSGKTRTNVQGYNLELLNASIIITAAIVLVTYIMYTVSPEVIVRTGTHPYPTSVFVLASILRYLQLTFVQKKSGNPTRILLSDWLLQLLILCWALSFIFILYLK